MDLSFSFSGRLAGRDPAVGLDIGSSAVRAVQLGGSPGKPRLVRFGQVGLEEGAVVEGEVRDEPVVAAAIRRLWDEVGFTSRKVVVNVSGQRVVVREAEVTAMSADDFRSALDFEAQDLIPIPTADAVMDFRILGEAPPSPEGQAQMRILLAAAHREAVTRVVETVTLANLEVVGVDVPQSALLRRVERSRKGDAYGLISVGAQLTNVIVQAGERGTFSRTLAIGTSAITSGLGLRLGLDHPHAETVKRSAVGDNPGASRAAALVRTEAMPIVEQIRESLEYFTNRTSLEGLEALLLTGGGARTAGLPELLGELTGTPVEVVDAFGGLETADFEPALLEAGRAVGLTAVGLACWESEAADRRLSLLPPEILAARKRRQTIVKAAAAGTALVVVLGAAWYAKHREVVSTRNQTAAVEAQTLALQGSSQSLTAVTGYFGAVSARQAALTGVASDVDWQGLIGQISAVMPANDTLTQLSVSTSTTAPASGVPATGSNASATPAVQISMSVRAAGGEQAVANWLRAMAKVPSLTNVWVASSTTNGGATTFTCTATVTPKAPKISYQWEKTK